MTKPRHINRWTRLRLFLGMTVRLPSISIWGRIWVIDGAMVQRRWPRDRVIRFGDWRHEAMWDTVEVGPAPSVLRRLRRRLREGWADYKDSRGNR